MSSPPRRRWTSRLGGWAFVRLQKWLGRKDAAGAERVGERLGRLAYRLSKKHRERALENLARAFPEATQQQRDDWAEGVLVHFGRVMSDFMRAATRSKQEVIDSIEASGIERIDEVLAAGKGVILVTAHFGNWERMANYLALKGYTLSVVARDANDPDMNALVAQLREAAGVEVISRGNAARAVLTKLRKNECVGILPDQNSDEIFVPFFGVPCGTVQGPAVLSQRSGAPILPMYCARIGVGKYRVWVEPPIEAEEGFEPVEGLTRAINASLEAAIRQYPDQYLWIHNRWKSAKARGLVP